MSREMTKPLSRREVDVLQLATQGLMNSEVAAELKITVNTVKKHLEHTRVKLRARNKAHAVAIGVTRNIVGVNRGGVMLSEEVMWTTKRVLEEHRNEAAFKAGVSRETFSAAVERGEIEYLGMTVEEVEGELKRRGLTW